jgi:hypothetical protein
MDGMWFVPYVVMILDDECWSTIDVIVEVEMAMMKPKAANDDEPMGQIVATAAVTLA